jgi:hypothetical protein
MIPASRRRHAAPLFLAAALACSSGGGGTAREAAPAPTAPPTDTPPVEVVLGTAPSFEGVATGNGWADGSASAAAGARYFRELSGSRGQLFELKNDAAGDEKDKACGKDWRASAARSVVVVTPEAGKGFVGFTLSATASARRGYWRTKATLSCTTLNHTDAQAASMARGQAWISLGGAADDRDQLVIETTGADAGEWALSVTDSAGQKFTSTQLGSTLVAALPRAGRYSVAASVTARAATTGTRDSAEQRLRASVRVFSLRNTLAARTERTPLPSLDIPVSSGVAAADLAASMQAALAGYRPCGAKPGCGGKVSDLSVQSVTVQPAGGGAFVEMVLVGAKRAPTTVRLVGVSEVRGDSLHLVNLRLAAGQPAITKKKDLSAATARLGERAAIAAVPLHSDMLVPPLQGSFPVRVGDLCAGAPPGMPRFLGTLPSPDDATAFRAYFSLTPGPLQPCGRPK